MAGEPRLTILERKQAMWVLLTVKQNPGLNKTQITRVEPGNESVRFKRINELIEEGLIEIELEDAIYTKAMKLSLTPIGEKVASLIQEMDEVLKK